MELQILHGGQSVVQGGVLKYDADRPAHRLPLADHIVPRHPGRTRGGLDERGQNLSGGGLARAVGPREAEHFTLARRERDALHGGKRPIVLGQRLHLNDIRPAAHGRSPLGASVPRSALASSRRRMRTSSWHSSAVSRERSRANRALACPALPDPGGARRGDLHPYHPAVLRGPLAPDEPHALQVRHDLGDGRGGDPKPGPRVGGPHRAGLVQAVQHHVVRGPETRVAQAPLSNQQPRDLVAIERKGRDQEPASWMTPHSPISSWRRPLPQPRTWLRSDRRAHPRDLDGGGGTAAQHGSCRRANGSARHLAQIGQVQVRCPPMTVGWRAADRGGPGPPKSMQQGQRSTKVHACPGAE